MSMHRLRLFQVPSAQPFSLPWIVRVPDERGALLPPGLEEEALLMMVRQQMIGGSVARSSPKITVVSRVLQWSSCRPRRPSRQQRSLGRPPFMGSWQLQSPGKAALDGMGKGLQPGRGRGPHSILTTFLLST